MALTLDISIFPSPITLSSAVTLTTLPITPHPYSLFWYSMNLHSRQIGNSLMRVNLLFLLCWRSDHCGQIYRQLYCRTLRRNSLLPLCGLHRQCWRWMLPVPWCSVRSCVSRWGSEQRSPAPGMVPHAAFMALSLISGKHKMVILYCLICPMISELLWMQSLVMQNWRPDICPLSDIASGRDKACCYRFLLLLEPFFWFNNFKECGVFFCVEVIKIKKKYVQQQKI